LDDALIGFAAICIAVAFWTVCRVLARLLPAQPATDRTAVRIESARDPAVVNFLDACGGFQQATREVKLQMQEARNMTVTEIDREYYHSLSPSFADVAERGLALLRSWLTPEQIEQYEARGEFEVIGGDTGKRYWIRHHNTVQELDDFGRPIAILCFAPESWLPAGDVKLAQKVALEASESDTLKKANRVPMRRYVS
jgi:hypothetical protein